MRRLLPFGLTAVVLVLAVSPVAGAQPKPEDCAWASACRDCHGEHYDAWEKTKHARATSRLTGLERVLEPNTCIVCHVTGAPPLLEKNVNIDVQCEACHGPGKAHIAAAAGGAAKPGSITRLPAESVCTACHSDKSPHFKFFSYAAMNGLVHPVPKK